MVLVGWSNGFGAVRPKVLLRLTNEQVCGMNCCDLLRGAELVFSDRAKPRKC
jgi:hypothetical protein